MQKVLILGANGATARIVINRLLKETDDKLSLYLRNSDRLKAYLNNDRVTLIDGNVQDSDLLKSSMKGIDIVYSNIGGVDLADSAKVILQAMKETGTKRLIFYSALGANHEVPGKFGQWNEKAIADYLPGFRKSAKLIDKEKDVITTQIHPAWLTDKEEINYETTGTNEQFKGTEVSRKSVADFVVKLIKDSSKYQNESVGLDKAGTDGDKPAWL
ncbi:MAG: NAD(P)H-binding protein [Liquorilactobacillus hordei]|uniref:NAD(P)H-binding protein n=1 Tax=Liquorilactobacillus hordei TaxID=468911 RepID=UPI0039E90950